MGRTHYLSCEEATNLSSGSNKPSKTPFRSAHGSPKSMPPPRERTPVKSPIRERTTQHERSKSLEPELKQPFRQQSASLNEKVVLPFTNKHDATPSIKSPEHLRQPILQQSTCLKEKVVMSFHNKGGATRSIKSPVRTRTLAELTGQKEKAVQPSQNRVDDATPPVNPPKSSTTKRKLTERPRIEAVPSIKVADVGREVVMAKSPKATEKLVTNTGGKNHGDVEARSSDAGKANLSSDLPVSQMNSPYIPSFLCYWT